MSALGQNSFDFLGPQPRRAGKPIGIFIAEDNEEIRTWLRNQVDLTPKFQFVGEAASGADALWQATSVYPQVMLIKAGFRGADGTNVIKTLKELLPDCKIIALIDPTSDEQISTSIAAGADGCCVRKVLNEDLKVAITSVAAGNTWYDPAVRHALARACAISSRLSEPQESFILQDQELDEEVVPSFTLCHRPRWYERRRWITTVHWLLVVLFAALVFLLTGPLVKAVLDHVNGGQSTHTAHSVVGPTAAIPGMAYTLFELQCRTWHRYRGTSALSLTTY